MKKLIYGALLLLAVPAFQSCIDDSESPSVTNARQEKTKQMAALTALYNAQATAAETIAEAEAAYKNALAAKTNAEAANAAAELAEIQERVKHQIQYYKNETLKLLKEYYELEANAANAQLLALVSAYTTAAEQLNDAQSELVDLQVQLVNAQYSLTNAQSNLSYFTNLYTNRLNTYNNQLANYQAQLDTYTEYTGYNVEELEAELAQARLKLTEATTLYNASWNTYISSNNTFNTAGSNLRNSPYMQAVRQFMSAPYTTRYTSDITSPNYNYWGYYEYDGVKQIFVPMFYDGAESTTEKLTTEDGTYSTTYDIYSSYYAYNEQGMESYLEYLKDQGYNAAPTEAEIAEALEAYQTALAAYEAAQDAVNEANEAAETAWDNYNAYFEKQQELYDAWQDALDEQAELGNDYADYVLNLTNKENTAKSAYEASNSTISTLKGKVEAYQKAITAAKEEAVKAELQEQLDIVNNALTAETANNAVLKSEYDDAAAAVKNAMKEEEWGASVEDAYNAYNTFVTDGYSVYNSLYTAVLQAQEDASAASQTMQLAQTKKENTYNTYYSMVNSGTSTYDTLEAAWEVMQGADLTPLIEAYNETGKTAAEDYIQYEEYYADYSAAQGAWSAINNMLNSLSSGYAYNITIEDLQNQIDNIKSNIALTEAQLTQLTETGTMSEEDAIRSLKTQIALLEEEIVIYQNQVDVTKKALEDYQAANGASGE